jgi:hypothetical protein
MEEHYYHTEDNRKMLLLSLENNWIDSTIMWFRCLFKTALALLTRIQRFVSIVNTALSTRQNIIIERVTVAQYLLKLMRPTF